MITQNKIHLHCYRNKTGKQFIDFLKRIDRRYDDKNIQIIFLVLDNISVHNSKIVKKEEISKRCPRIKFVFLPVRSPEPILIEVRWLWLQRQTINNSTFKDEQEIGQAVSKWKTIYNKNHGRGAITNILQENISLSLYSSKVNRVSISLICFFFKRTNNLEGFYFSILIICVI
jgi:hypothetical protein